MISKYNVVKSKRKSYGISIKYDGAVIIRVPDESSETSINQFIDKYKNWVNERLTNIITIKEQQSTEALFYYLGNRYSVKKVTNQKENVKFDGHNFLVSENHQGNPADPIHNWYAIQARELVTPIMEEYSKRFDLKYSGIRITKAQTRWGSCSSEGLICFSYKIAMLPLDVITYIVIHELAHLKHFDHSKNFWKEVENMCPNYKAAKNWIKENRFFLKIQFV